MLEYLPQEVRDGLEAARKRDLRKKSRLRIRVNDEVFPVLKFWETGFALDAARAPHLRGLVDLYDGSRHLSQCLIIASDEEDGHMNYEFKRKAEAHDQAPLDFAREENSPVGLIGKLA